MPRGGPVLSFSAEDDASLSDSFTGGGIVGVSYRSSETFSIGVGLGVLSQIDDDAAIFPFITLNWQAAAHSMSQGIYSTWLRRSPSRV